MSAMFLIILCVISVFADDCLIYTPSGASEINLSGLKGTVYSYALSGQHAGHTLWTTIGQNLDDSHRCSSTQTDGPKTSKDEYASRDGNGNDCWYVGGMDGCTFDRWDDGTQTSVLYYKGVPDTENEIRNMEINIHCDSSKTSAVFTVDDVTESGNQHTYKCTLDTAHGCPGANPVVIDDYWFFDDIMGVGGILLIVLLCLIIIYFAAVGPIVWAVRKFKFQHTLEDGNHPVLFFKILKTFVLLVWGGIMMIVELIKMCIGKISKKGSYSEV